MVYHDKSSLGQNFIKYPKLVDELLKATDVGKDDVVIEIGPGKGIITKKLCTMAGDVIAIEKDKILAENIEKKSNLTVINKDFLDFDLPEFNYKIVANIPFSITAEIINKIMMADNLPETMYLIMQLEAALKFTGENGETLSSVLTQPWFEVEILGEIDRTNFINKPQVKIVFAKFIKRKKPFIKDEEKLFFRMFVNYGFRQWKATWSDSYKKLFTYNQLKAVEKIFGIRGSKLSEVSFDNWLLLFKNYQKIATPESKKILEKFNDGRL